MKISGLFALTSGVTAGSQLNQLKAKLAARATEGNFDRKAGNVEKIANRLVKRWEDKLEAKLGDIGCLADGNAQFSSAGDGCPVLAIAEMEADLNLWLNTYIDTSSDNAKCANFKQRNVRKIVKAISKINSKHSTTLRDCPNGSCVGGKCVFDLKNGGFGGDGKVIGRVAEDNENVIEFSNIQFATTERFRAPVAVSDFASPDFSADGKSCVTTAAVSTGSESLPRDTEEVEDCLYIRIWIKKDALMGGEARKVISWIHGGTFNFGGVDVIYESPSKLVDEQDLIVAKMNYRLGPFGNWLFPANPTGEAKSGWGIQDQQMGLKWIKDNIGMFNGDAEDITLGGASAGGMAAMVHMTNSESHDLFHNALVIGPPQIPFWDLETATSIYGHITVAILQCTTQENFLTDLMTGNILTCLQSIPLDTFRGAMAQHGSLVFQHFAVEAGKLTQLEQAFGINIDGDIVKGDPHKIFKENDANVIKQDMGFYVHEIGLNEGTSMVQNLFSQEAFLQTLYKENYPLIFQDFNAHIRVPKPAHDGLMGAIYGAAGPEFMAALNHEDALGCPNPVENDPYGGLLTECKLKTSDWITSWLWHCNIGDSHREYSASPLYMVDFAAAYPGPDHQEDGVLLPDTAGVNDCYEAGREQSCHITGQAYFFGEADNQGISQTAEELAFGVSYRTLYADLIKNGSSAKLISADMFEQINPQLAGAFNNIDIGNSANPMENYSLPNKRTCMTFDMIQQYGNV